LAYTTEFSWEGAKYAEAKSEDLPLSEFCGPQGYWIWQMHIA